MSFDPVRTETQISESIGAMVLLHSSNQALIEVSITPSDSPWYPILNSELGAMENLVVDWRQNGFLYFQQQILQQVVSCGESFLGARAKLDKLFEKLENDFSDTLKQQIVAELMALQSPVESLQSSISAYLDQLQSYQSALSAPYHRMVETASRVQAEEANIQAEIKVINAEIIQMKAQLIKDRQAIAKAKAARKRGITETIFGVLLSPFTGGLSLILAGIGVGTIAEAEEKMHALQSNITSSQRKIASDQVHLSDDQKQIATLHGLTMSVELAMSDISGIETALGRLGTSWSVLAGEISNEADNVAKSSNAKSALMSRVWFDAACDGWNNIIQFAKDYSSANAPTPRHVSIG